MPAVVFNFFIFDKVEVDALLKHPGVYAVCLVGSTPIAVFVHREGTSLGKRVQSLGGA